MGERCSWCGVDSLYVDYHDHEWGLPERDSRALYEKLVLDGFQAGLSWYTILRKRENFRAAFAGFDPDAIATWGEPDVVRLLGDAGIVRHRGKIEGAILNARAWQQVEADVGFNFSRPASLLGLLLEFIQYPPGFALAASAGRKEGQA